MRDINENESSLIALEEYYGRFLDEIRARLGAINLAVRIPGMHPNFIKEFCFLQLRFICELFAISVLVIHEQIAQDAPQVLLKKYEPGKIIKHLEEINPGFFPVPISLYNNLGEFSISPVDVRCVSKSDVVSIWNMAGCVLHTGGFKKVAFQKMADESDIDQIIDFGQRFLNLLHIHRLVRIDGTEVIAILTDPSRNGDADVFIKQPSSSDITPPPR